MDLFCLKELRRGHQSEDALGEPHRHEIQTMTNSRMNVKRANPFAPSGLDSCRKAPECNIPESGMLICASEVLDVKGEGVRPNRCSILPFADLDGRMMTPGEGFRRGVSCSIRRLPKYKTC